MTSWPSWRRTFREHGLIEPIILSHDQSTIIDGRNRYRACIAAETFPVFDVLEASYTELMIIDLIVSVNLKRRAPDRRAAGVPRPGLRGGLRSGDGEGRAGRDGKVRFRR